MNRKKPTLSVVAVSRNDEHGGDILGRMQHFIDGFIAQCKRHDLSAELVLVEWNPPSGRIPLAELLVWPNEFGPATIRIVTVPNNIHSYFKNSEKKSLFQMIGKNVGVRRARAPFILATNIDIIFNDKLFQYMRDKLDSKTILRVDRFDIPVNLPRGVHFHDVLSYCESSFYNIYTRFGVYNVEKKMLLGRRSHNFTSWLAEKYYHLRLESISSFNMESCSTLIQSLKINFILLLTELGWITIFIISKILLLKNAKSNIYQFFSSTWRKLFKIFCFDLSQKKIIILSVLNIKYYLSFLLKKIRFICDNCANFIHLTKKKIFLYFNIMKIRCKRIFFFHDYAKENLYKTHTVACGDFTLMSSENWFRLCGYAEWPISSLHIDSILMYAATALGIKQVALDLSYRIYHIEHALGSGWSPRGEEKLLGNLNKLGVPYLKGQRVMKLRDHFLSNPQSAIINDEDWGLRQHNLPEVSIMPGGRIVVEVNR